MHSARRAPEAGAPASAIKNLGTIFPALAHSEFYGTFRARGRKLQGAFHMKAIFKDKPVAFPKKRPDGHAMKSMTQALLDRRATPHLKTGPVPGEHTETLDDIERKILEVEKLPPA
jgi:hypothetical protein